jgi:formylglycine-generating enzyme required for sulfatase activity
MQLYRKLDIYCTIKQIVIIKVQELNYSPFRVLESLMARIFVSYSRKNKEFCKQLTNELQKRAFDFWVDWEGIPPTVDWMKEIEKGIEEADTFLAIVTPDWISSKVCIDELDIAVKNGKRLIPVVPCDIVWNSVPFALAQLNFIFFTEAFDFNEQLNKLFTALDTDYNWLKTHRRLQVKALEWERANKEGGFLLRGRDLEDAEQQISVNANKDPHPTDIQRDYVLKSRQGATRQRRITTSVLSFIIVMLIGISAYLGIPRIMDKLAQSNARGEMVLMPEGPSVFGTDTTRFIEIGFPKRQNVKFLPAFQINKYEVTNYQYGQCVKYGICTVPANQTEFQDASKQQYPVVNVTLFQAGSYCRWLGQRLPNQFEWERAARGPELYQWPWGNNQEPTSETANMPWNNYIPSGTLPVNSNPAGKSPEGIYNLVGNVSEWTSSIIPNKPLTYDPTQIWDGSPNTFDGTLTFAQRGGGWWQGVDEVGTFIADLGVSARNDLGFRCAADAK